jgi:hypothetical protein
MTLFCPYNSLNYKFNQLIYNIVFRICFLKNIEKII